MRKILFRGRDIANNWHYGDIEYFTDDFVKIVNHSNHEYGKKVESNTIGQYTGLSDINGQAIYEGDIVKDGTLKKAKAMPYEVRFDRQRLLYCIRRHGNQKDLWAFANDLEVIGNIYDNPELMEV